MKEKEYEEKINDIAEELLHILHKHKLWIGDELAVIGKMEDKLL